MDFYHLCDICSVPLYSVSTFDDHYVSKAHQKNRTSLGHGPIGLQVYVKGYPPKITRPSDLYFLFSKYGVVKDINLLKRTFAFVTFDEQSHAENAIQSSPLWIGNNKITVRPVINKSPPEPWQLLYAPSPHLPEASVPEAKLEEMLNECPSVEKQMEKFVRWAQLLPAERNARLRFLQYLSSGLRRYFPNASIHVYGSSANGFVLRGSDMDVRVSLDNNGQAKQNQKLNKKDISSSREVQRYNDQIRNSPKNVDKSLMAQLIHESFFTQLKVLRKVIKCHVPGAQNVFVIPSRNTPILRLGFEGIFTCDLKVNPGYEMENTALLRFYGQLDPRVTPLIVTLRLWARRNELVGPNTLSSYALTFLAIFFLQNTTPPILPSVQQLREPLGPPREKQMSEWDCSFCDDIKKFPPSSNAQTTGELLCQFFEFYTKFNFVDFMISPSKGKAVPIQECLYDPDMKLFTESIISLQDPFELTRNLTARCHARYVAQFQSHLKVALELCRSARFSAPNDDKKSLWGLSLLFQPKDPEITFKIPIISRNFTRAYVLAASTDNSDSLCSIVSSTFLELLRKVLQGECFLNDPSDDGPKQELSSDPELSKVNNDSIPDQNSLANPDLSKINKEEMDSNEQLSENLDNNGNHAGQGVKRSSTTAKLEDKDKSSKRLALAKEESSFPSKLAHLKGQVSRYDQIQTILCNLYYPLWLGRPEGELDPENDSFLQLWEANSLEMLQNFPDKPKYPLGQVKFQLSKAIAPITEIRLTMTAKRCLLNDDLFNFIDTYTSYILKKLPS